MKYLRDVMHLLLGREVIRNSKMNHIVYRVMFYLGYKDWIQKKFSTKKIL